MTALQNLLKYTKLDKAGFVDEEQDSSQLDETPTEEDSVKEAQALLDATEDKLGPAQQAAFDRQSEYTKHRNEPGVLSRDVAAIWNIGVESAGDQARAAAGNMPTDSLTAKPGVKPPKTGGGRSSNVPARSAGIPRTTASTSTLVAQQRAKQPKLPVGQQMMKNLFLQKRKSKAARQFQGAGKPPKTGGPPDLTQANLPKKIKVPKQPTVTPDPVPEVAPTPQQQTIDPHTFNLKRFGKGSHSLPPAVKGVPYEPPPRPEEEDSIQNMNNFRSKRGGEWSDIGWTPTTRNLTPEQKRDAQLKHHDETDALMQQQWEAHEKIYPKINATGHFTEEDWRKEHEEWGREGGSDNWEKVFNEFKEDEGHLWAKWGDSSESPTTKLVKAVADDKYEKEFGEYTIPERKLKKQMGVSGAGVKNLQQLIGERAREVKDKQEN